MRLRGLPPMYAVAFVSSEGGSSPPPSPTNQAPFLLGSISDFTVEQGGSHSIASAFIDPEGDTMSYGLAEGTLSTGLSFAANGAFSATPSATLGTVGPVMVYAEDGHLDNVTTFTLTTAAATGTYPFTIGLGFKKADVPDSFCLDISTAQVVVKRRWNDGSVKHAIVSGHTALTQNVSRTITVIRGHAAPGTALTSSDIQTAAPTATIQCGAIGTVTLSSLLSSPVRTWISGPEMVECHYRADIGSTLMSAWFHVRLFADGRKWVRTIVENGYLDDGAGALASNTDRSYVPTITIGGVVVYNNSGSSLSHYVNSSYMAEGWIGGDPQITPAHNVAYLRASKIFPNYFWNPPTEATLSGNIATSMPTISGEFHMIQTYTPMSTADINTSQGGTGYQTQIGLIPIFDALYITSSDPRAYRCMLANASANRSFPMCWRDATTKLPIKPSAFPTWSIDGPGAGGTAEVINGTGKWEYNHHASAGFSAYLLTGDYWHYETMLMQASMAYLVCGQGSDRGTGTSRHVWQQSRGLAWGLRTLMQLSAIYPTGDAVAAEYQTLLSSNADWLKTYVDDPSTKPLGRIFEYGTDPADHVSVPPPDPIAAISVCAPWQHNWMVAVLGWASDLEPLASMTNWNAVRDWYYQWPVGLLGDTGSSNYHFTRAGAYHLDVTGLAGSSWPSTSPDNLLPTWGAVWTQNWGFANAETGNTLKDSNINGMNTPALAPGLGHWGNLLAAIAYAVDHSAPGAQAAFNRLVGATNWNDIPTGTNAAESGISTGYGTFYDNPTTGIAPRNWSG